MGLDPPGLEGGQRGQATVTIINHVVQKYCERHVEQDEHSEPLGNFEDEGADELHFNATRAARAGVR